MDKINTESIQEFLELCYVAEEDGILSLDRAKLPDNLLCYSPKAIEPHGEQNDKTIDVMLHEKLLTAEGRLVRLTEHGRQKAREMIRRHRLTEVLLHNILNVSDDSMESVACQAEHILNPEVTDAVCTFLGHPPVCPHGRAIPQGPCCKADISTVTPLIAALSDLPIGESGIVAFIHTKRHQYLKQLGSFGVAPGQMITLKQTRPTYVILCGETELALDEESGNEIYLKRIRNGSKTAS